MLVACALITGLGEADNATPAAPVVVMIQGTGS
jgi:hypothetical protein